MPSTDARDHLRLLHWNIHSWRDDASEPNLEALASLIDEMRPHVVSLVEVDEEWNAPGTLDVLAQRCGYASIFVPAFEYGDNSPRGGFGNVLLTTLPILAVRQRQLVWPVPTYERTESSEPRSVLLARLDFQGLPVWVGSTHLPWADEEVRKRASQRLKGVMAQLEEPWILCGDFNTPAASWLNESDELRAWPDPPMGTYPASEPTEAIDYCVAPAELHVEATVLGVQGSDHLSVTATVQF
jgi:endonuclease/exonuclease/phosphatase family metal-dependent hydrolase